MYWVDVPASKVGRVLVKLKEWVSDRYWAVTIPLYILVVIALAIVGYVGATLLIVPPPDSIHTLIGE